MSEPVQLAAEEMTNFLSRELGKLMPIVRWINPAKATIILGTNTSFTFPDKAREAGYPNVNSTTTRTEIQQLPERKSNNYPNVNSIITRTEPKVVCRDKDAVRVCGGKVFCRKRAGGGMALFVPKPPKSGEEYRDILVVAGAHAYVAPGSYFRRHGDVFMFNIGTKGRHVITLPECDRGVHVVELFSGVRMPAADIAVDSDGAGTWFFKLARCSFFTLATRKNLPPGRTVTTDILSVEAGAYWDNGHLVRCCRRRQGSSFGFFCAAPRFSRKPYMRPTDGTSVVPGTPLVSLPDSDMLAENTTDVHRWSTPRLGWFAFAPVFGIIVDVMDLKGEK